MLLIVIGAAAGSKHAKPSKGSKTTSGVHSGTAKYRIDVTAAVPYSSNTVGVAFNVENVGTAAGSPSCVVIAAVAADDGGAHGVVLDSIKPGHFDYEAAAGDVVTLSGVDASAVILPGGVSVKC